MLAYSTFVHVFGTNGREEVTTTNVDLNYIYTRMTFAQFELSFDTRTPVS